VRSGGVALGDLCFPRPGGGNTSLKAVRRGIRIPEVRTKFVFLAAGTLAGSFSAATLAASKKARKDVAVEK